MFLGESSLAEHGRERKTKTKSYGSPEAPQVRTVGFRTAAAANPERETILILANLTYSNLCQQYGKKAMQQNVLAYRQHSCYNYGNSAILFAVLLATRHRGKEGLCTLSPC